MNSTHAAMTLRVKIAFGTILAGSAWLIACSASPPPPSESPADAPAASTTLPPAPVESASSVAPPPPPAKPEPPKPPAPVLRFAQGLSTPESVLYDATADRYLVSNINGNPSDASDNNGYISELSPEGKVLREKFIAGGVNGVKLNSPKGSAIAQGVLYVSDVNVVRKFDAQTGAPKGDIPIPGATFLNDVSASAEGRVFVSDSGFKFTANGQEPTGTDAVFVIDKGKVTALAKGKDLGNPNGVLAWDKSVLVASSTGELYRLDEKGQRADLTKLPKAGLDGLVQVGDMLLVSSWEAQSVFRGKLGQTFEPVLSNLNAPADIGYDTKRGRVLVPRFLDNAVEIYDLK